MSNPLSLSLDTTAEHDALDAAFADWPEEVKAKMPTRAMMPDPVERRAALEAARPHALAVAGIVAQREAEIARRDAGYERDRQIGAARLRWDNMSEAQRNELRAQGIRSARELAGEIGVDFEAQKRAKLADPNYARSF